MNHPALRPANASRTEGAGHEEPFASPANRRSRRQRRHADSFDSKPAVDEVARSGCLAPGVSYGEPLRPHQTYSEEREGRSLESLLRGGTDPNGGLRGNGLLRSKAAALTN